MATREEHLVRCKQEAIARLEAGDLSGAIASMISDLKKAGDPLYDATVLRELLVEALGPSNHAGRSPILDQQLQLMCHFTGHAFECRHRV